jgi:hypothetical protein
MYSCTVRALRLFTGLSVHRGSRGIALPFLDHGIRRGWGFSFTPPPLFTPGKDPVLIVQKAGWAPGPVWTGAENLAPTWIRSPDRPARSQSLYRLSYPAHCLSICPHGKKLCSHCADFLDIWYCPRLAFNETNLDTCIWYCPRLAFNETNLDMWICPRLGFDVNKINI